MTRPAFWATLSSDFSFQPPTPGAGPINTWDTPTTIQGVTFDGTDLTINYTGMYLSLHNTTTTQTSANRTDAYSELQLDTGGGFAGITGARAWHYSRTSTAAEQTATVSWLGTLSAGDKLRIYCARGTGASTGLAMLAEATNWTLTRLDTRIRGGGLHG